MVKRKLVIFLLIGVTLLIAGSTFAYYHFTTPKKEKKIVLASRVTPTPTTLPSATPTSSPSATPTPIVKYIYYPTPTPAPDFKQVLNEYEECKKACPIVDEGTTCTENSENNTQSQSPVCEIIEGSDGSSSQVKCTSRSGGGGKTCKSNKHPDEACINSCKGKYGLNF
jgi:hypothetical protein